MSEDLSWGRTTVDTACPLDCPDTCSLSVTVERGKVTKIDGNRRAPSPTATSAARSGNFADHVYGEDRLLHPGRSAPAPKGTGEFRRVTWDEALDLIAARMREVRDALRRRGDPALSLRRLERLADAGRRRTRASSAGSARRASRARSARRRPAPPRTALYGKMPGVAYEDYEPRG